MFFNDTITIYNHYTENYEDKWNRKILTGCMWRKTKSKSVSDGKINTEYNISITIPYTSGYVEPKEYEKLEDKTNYWTLNADNNLDTIVLGAVEKELTENYTITDLRKDYEHVTVISQVANNELVDYLKHWKVICK